MLNKVGEEETNLRRIKSKNTNVALTLNLKNLCKSDNNGRISLHLPVTKGQDQVR